MPDSPSPSQTLSRGLRALEILAAAPTPLSIAELAAGLGVHRSIAYRILRTLEDHALVVRDDAGRLLPGAGLAVLARSVARDLQSAALPELTAIAEELSMTAFVGVWNGEDCVTLVTVEPRHSGAALAQRPGTRHPLAMGAPGLAIASALTAERWRELVPGQPYRPAAAAARELGFAVSHDEVISGVSSVACPILVPGHRPAALAVVYVRADQQPESIGGRLAASALRIQAALG